MFFLTLVHQVLEQSNKNIYYRNLNEFERLESSTYRELLAITHAIIAFDNLLRGKNILWHTDNISAALIIWLGSNKDKLQSLANDIYSLCKNKNISLKVTWLAREYNSVVDSISKSIDYDY